MNFKQNRLVQNIIKLHHNIVKGATWAAALSMVAMTLITAVNVFARYVFHKPVAGAIELSALVLVTTVFFGMAYTEACEQHIVFREIVDRLPGKIRSTIMGTMRFIAALFFVVLGCISLVLAYNFLRPMPRMTNVLHIPISPVILVIAFGSFLMAFQLIMESFFRELTDLDGTNGDA